MYCVHCGAKNSEDSIFCYKCGHKLKFRKSGNADFKPSKEPSPSKHKEPVKKESFTESSSPKKKFEKQRTKLAEKEEEELEVLTVEEFQRMKSSSKQPRTEFSERKTPSKPMAEFRGETTGETTFSKRPKAEFGEEKAPGKPRAEFEEENAFSKQPKMESEGIKEFTGKSPADYSYENKDKDWQKKSEMVEAELRRKIDNLTDLISRLHEENLELEKELAKCKDDMNRDDMNIDKGKPKKDFQSKNKSSDDLLTRLKKW